MVLQSFNLASDQQFNLSITRSTALTYTSTSQGSSFTPTLSSACPNSFHFPRCFPLDNLFKELSPVFPSCIDYLYRRRAQCHSSMYSQHQHRKTKGFLVNIDLSKLIAFSTSHLSIRSYFSWG
jgi:hypothetical protein